MTRIATKEDMRKLVENLTGVSVGEHIDSLPDAEELKAFKMNCDCGHPYHAGRICLHITPRKTQSDEAIEMCLCCVSTATFKITGIHKEGCAYTKQTACDCGLEPQQA